MKKFSTTPKKPDLYKFIHKYARHEINKVTELAGKSDLYKPKEHQQFTEQFSKLISFLDHHAYSEDTYFHPLLKECHSDKLPQVEEEHKKSDEEIKKLKNNLNNIKNSEDSQKFYLDLVNFQIGYFQHLNYEERVLLPELHKNFTSEILEQASDELLRNMPRDTAREITKGMLPVLTHEERVEMFTGMKASMPPHVFTGMCELASSVLTSEQTENLFKAIDHNSDSSALKDLSFLGAEKKRKGDPEGGKKSEQNTI